MQLQHLMGPSIRLLLVGVVLLSPGYLAPPAAAGTEPETLSAWTGEHGAEPTAAATNESSAAASPMQQPAPGDGSAAQDVDLWVEFFTTPTPSATASAKTEPAGAISRTAAAILSSSSPTGSSATGDSKAGVGNSYKIQQNDTVQRFLDQFQTGYRRAVVERWLTRSGRFLPMILEVFKQKGLPEELVFAAMIESGFDPVAVSRAGAKGLWQFMAPTARQYGLRVDRWLDERLDPEKSTVAAANYLKDLYTIFGSWDLVQAAYNAGEMKVIRAIQGTGTRDFWSLTHSRLLRDETKNYVPAIHAVTIISQEPEQYGFAVTPDEPLSYERITVPKGTSLKHVATLSGISFEELVRLNSELRMKQTPPDSPYHLKVPLGSGPSLQAGLEREVETRKAAAAARLAERTPKKKGQLAVQKAAAVKPRVSRPRVTEQGGFR
jgi:membrane-bound lytic murein transglycosylase D